jgi:16S rRNA (guanine966-N2)-methyltransferase
MRVIAGTLRSRRLKTPAGAHTRPTADRAREGLFSILGSMHDLRVLDLYAGTGALGIEALSRGARSATFVESDRSALACLLDNLETLGLTLRTNVIRSAVERSRSTLVDMAPFDLIFCDPPWRTTANVWEQLRSSRVSTWLPVSGRLVLEHPATVRPNATPIPDLALVCVRAWGDSAVTILSRTAESDLNI